MNINPTTPLGWAVLDLQVRLERVRQNEERGASAIEWVIITAVLVGLALLVAAVVRSYVQDEADKIK